MSEAHKCTRKQDKDSDGTANRRRDAGAEKGEVETATETESATRTACTHTHMRTNTCKHTQAHKHMHLSRTHACATCLHRRVGLTREDCLRLDAHCREFQALPPAPSPSNRSSNAPRLSSVSLARSLPPPPHTLLPPNFLSFALGLPLPNPPTHTLPSTTHTHTLPSLRCLIYSLGLGFKV